MLFEVILVNALWIFSGCIIYRLVEELAGVAMIFPMFCHLYFIQSDTHLDWILCHWFHNVHDNVELRMLFQVIAVYTFLSE